MENILIPVKHLILPLKKNILSTNSDQCGYRATGWRDLAEHGWWHDAYRAGRQRHRSGRALLQLNTSAIMERSEAGTGERHSSWATREER